MRKSSVKMVCDSEYKEKRILIFSDSANRKTTQLENIDKRKGIFSLQVRVLVYTYCGLPLAILSYPQMSDYLYLASLIADITSGGVINSFPAADSFRMARLWCEI